MTNNPSPLPRISAEKKEKLIRFIKKIINRITHNWKLKLTCLLLAVFLWGGLISQNETLPRAKTIQDVPVTVANESVLKQNGLIVVSGLDETHTVRLKADVPQRNYNTVTAANYSVRLDLSQIQSTGKQTVPLIAVPASASLYGTVTDIYPSEITVVVAEYSTRNRIPVQVEEIGTLPDGYFGAAPSPSPAAVEISGPKSLVDAVARCVVKYDASQLPAVTGNVMTSSPFVLQDQKGNEIDMRHISITGQSVALRDIIVEQMIYPLVSVPVNTNDLFSGKPAEGYQVTGVSIYPENVLIAAEDLSPYLAEGASIQPYNRISLINRTASFTGSLSMRKPSTAAYMNTYDIQVNVTIEPVNTGEENKLGD